MNLLFILLLSTTWAGIPHQQQENVSLLAGGIVSFICQIGKSIKKSFLFKVKCRIVQGLTDNAARRTRRIISYWTWANWIKCAVWMQWSSSDTQCIQIKHYLELFSVSQRGLAGSVNTDTALNWAFRISRMNSLYTLNEFKHAPATINHSHVHRCG